MLHGDTVLHQSVTQKHLGTGHLDTSGDSPVQLSESHPNVFQCREITLKKKIIVTESILEIYCSTIYMYLCNSNKIYPRLQKLQYPQNTFLLQWRFYHNFCSMLCTRLISSSVKVKSSGHTKHLLTNQVHYLSHLIKLLALIFEQKNIFTF